MTAETAAAPSEGNQETPVPPSRPETNPHRLRILQGRYTGPTDTDGQLRLAASLAKARNAIPFQYRNNPGDILAVIQHAVALDIQLATALDNLVFSDSGVGGMRARLMHALLTRAGHEVVVTHHDDRICRMVLKRGDGRRGGGAQWTLSEATNAGLLEKKGSPWRFYGEDMLWARCLSRLARRYAPETIAGFYVADELDDIPADDELDSADLATPMTDADGEPVVAPDVEDLLKDTDTQGMTPQDARELLRNRWRLAKEEGLLGVYAGTVDGVALTVKDYLFGRLADVEAAEHKAQAAGGVAPVDLGRVVADAQGTTPAPQPPPPATGPDAPAGTGQMSCGCESAAVLAANGTHQPGCTRPARPRRGQQ